MTLPVLDQLQSIHKRVLEGSYTKEDIESLENAKRGYSEMNETGTSPLDNEDYDLYVLDSLFRIDKNNPVLKEVGALSSNTPLDKVKLPEPCGSLENVKTEEEYQKWISSIININQMPVVSLQESQKLDGISILIEYRYQVLFKAYKRGKGIVGHDVTNHILAMDVPQKIKTPYNILLVRGEAVMKEQTFINKYRKKDENDKGYQTSRNMVAGKFNDKKPDAKVMKDIDFVSYEIKNLNLANKSEQFNMLQALGFKTAIHQITDLSYASLVAILAAQKKVSPYLMDGIVVDINDVETRKKLGFETNSINPKYARALKVRTKEDEYKTKVVGRDWNVSKNGLLKPRILLEKVVINGVNVTAATGKNARTVVNLGLGVGAEIVITRSGDAIPDILFVTKKADPDLPTHCPSCGAKLGWTTPSVPGWQSKDLICLNEECDGRSYKRLLAFFRGIETEEFNKGTAQKCIDAGYRTMDMVLRMQETHFVGLEGFGQKSAQKLCANIRAACESTSMAKIMHATGFFGRSLGSTKLGDILDAFGEDKTLDMANDASSAVVAYVAGLPNFQLKTSKLFAEGIVKFYTWWQENKKFFVTSKPVSVSSKFAGQNILFTGFRDSSWKKKIEKNGGKVLSGISKKVTLLVCKDIDKSSDKIEKANSFNIKIIDIEEFNKIMEKL